MSCFALLTLGSLRLWCLCCMCVRMMPTVDCQLKYPGWQLANHQVWVWVYETFTFTHLADALIQSDLQKVQGHSPYARTVKFLAQEHIVIWHGRESNQQPSDYQPDSLTQPPDSWDLIELLKMCMSRLAVTFSNSDLGLTWRENTVCGVHASASCVFSLYFQTIRLLRVLLDTKSPI